MTGPHSPISRHRESWCERPLDSARNASIARKRGRSRHDSSPNSCLTRSGAAQDAAPESWRASHGNYFSVCALCLRAVAVVTMVPAPLTSGIGLPGGGRGGAGPCSPLRSRSLACPSPKTRSVPSVWRPSRNVALFLSFRCNKERQGRANAGTKRRSKIAECYG